MLFKIIACVLMVTMSITARETPQSEQPGEEVFIHLPTKRKYAPTSKMRQEILEKLEALAYDLSHEIESLGQTIPQILSSVRSIVDNNKKSLLVSGSWQELERVHAHLQKQVTYTQQRRRELQELQQVLTLNTLSKNTKP